MPSFNRHKNKKIFVITKISDELWYNISDLLPDEKLNNTIGRPIGTFRKVLKIFYTFLEPHTYRKQRLQNLVLVIHLIGDFSRELR